MPRNPWLDLPKKPPYVLPADRPHVEAFNRQNAGSGDSKYQLDLRLMPEPFGGNRQAKLVLLNRNPGLSPGDFRVHRDYHRYVAALRANLGSAPGGHRGVALLPEFKETPAGRWCRERCFKALIDRSHAPEDLTRKILSVEFHGYHSERWRPIGFTLPSQHYAFWLVQQAMARGATVVVMRGRRDWEVAVPRLQDYEGRVILRSFRSPAISERNCGREGFERVVAALE
jgi:hypothetical protein